MKAAGDSGLKVRFATYWMDQPGNVANAGATAIGHFNVSSFYPEANGDATAKFADDFKAKTGQYPVFIQGHTVHGIWGLGEALKKLKAGRRQAQRQAARLRHGDRQLQHRMGAGRHAHGGSPGVAPAGGRHRLEGGQVQGGRHRHGLQAAPPHIRARRRRARCSPPARWSARPPEAAPVSRGAYGAPASRRRALRHCPLTIRGAPGLEYLVVSVLNGVVHGLLLFMVSAGLDADLRHDGRPQFRPRLVLHAGRLCRLHPHPHASASGPGLMAAPLIVGGLRRPGRALHAAPRAPVRSYPRAAADLRPRLHHRRGDQAVLRRLSRELRHAALHEVRGVHACTRRTIRSIACSWAPWPSSCSPCSTCC